MIWIFIIIWLLIGFITGGFTMAYFQNKYYILKKMQYLFRFLAGYISYTSLAVNIH